MTVAMPTPFQTSMPMMEYSAMFTFPSQSGPVMPSAPSAALISPRVGCISDLNVKPTASVEIRLGKNRMDRRIWRDLSIAEERIAPKNNPSTTLNAQVRTE